MSDVSRKVVPDKGSLNRERGVPILHKKAGCCCCCCCCCCCFFVCFFLCCFVLLLLFFFVLSELERRVRDGVYTKRHDDNNYVWRQGTINQTENKGGHREDDRIPAVVAVVVVMMLMKRMMMTMTTLAMTTTTVMITMTKTATTRC